MNNISFITRAEALSRMNEWGRRQVPFFFLTDADGEKCLVEPLDRIPADELRFAFPGMSVSAVILMAFSSAVVRNV